MTTPMRISNELRVGIMFLTGLVLLVLIIVTLTRWGQDRNTYSFTIRFRQAQGILEGAAVRVAGVQVGRVTSVDFDSTTNQALVTVRVNSKVRLYERYHYTIGIGGLVGERFVEIRPTEGDRGGQLVDGSIVNGTPTPDMNQLFENANTLVDKLTETADSLNSIIASPTNQRNIESALASLNEASKNASLFTNTLNQTAQRNVQSVDEIVANLRQVSCDVRQISESLTPQLANSNIVRNLELASARVNRITQRFEGITTSVEGVVNNKETAASIRTTFANIQKASEDIEAALAQARIASGSLPRMASNLEKATESLPGMASNLEKATADLPGITGPIREITPETANNIRQISTNLREASEDINQTAKQVAGTTSAITQIRVQPDVEVSALTDSNSRAVANLDFKSRTGMFRAGVVGTNNTTFVNAQLGNKLGSNLWLRYGMIQSHLGVGADYQFNRDLRVTGELFAPQRLQANAIGYFRLKPLGESFWLTTGWYGIFHDSAFGIGLTYRP